MKFSVDFSVIIAVIGALTAVTNIIVQVLKGLTREFVPTNLLALFVAMALTLAVFFAYMAYAALTVVWYHVVAAVVAGFAVAYAAMFGFDKLREALGDFFGDNPVR